MRHSVTTPLYRLRKLFDGFLSRWSPFVPFSILSDQLVATTFVQGAARGWLPLYTMVTFRPDISYATVRRKAAEQNRFLTALGLGTASGTMLLVGMWVVSLWRARQ
jgi:kynurenine 3-monooxygenase